MLYIFALWFETLIGIVFLSLVDRGPKHTPETHASHGNQERSDGVFCAQKDKAVTNTERNGDGLSKAEPAVLLGV